MAGGASAAPGPRCTPGSLLPIRQPHFSHFTLIIFCFMQIPPTERGMEMYFAIPRVPAAQPVPPVSLRTRLVPLRLGMLIPSRRLTAGLRARSPRITPFSPVPSKLAAQYYTVTNGSRRISTTAAQHGYNFDLPFIAGTVLHNYGYGRKDARATGGGTQKAAKLSSSRDFGFCFP